MRVLLLVALSLLTASQHRVYLPRRLHGVAVRVVLSLANCVSSSPSYPMPKSSPGIMVSPYKDPYVFPTAHIHPLLTRASQGRTQHPRFRVRLPLSLSPHPLLFHPFNGLISVDSRAAALYPLLSSTLSLAIMIPRTWQRFIARLLC